MSGCFLFEAFLEGGCWDGPVGTLYFQFCCDLDTEDINPWSSTVLFQMEL